MGCGLQLLVHFSTRPQAPRCLSVTEVVFLQVAEAEERVVQTLLSHPQESGRVVFGQLRKCKLGSWPLCPLLPATRGSTSLSLSLSLAGPGAGGTGLMTRQTRNRQLLPPLSRSVVSDSSVTPWAVAHQAPLSVEFPRQESWSGLSFPSPGDLPDPGIEPMTFACQADPLPPYQLGSPGTSRQTSQCVRVRARAGCQGSQGSREVT